MERKPENTVAESVREEVEHELMFHMIPFWKNLRDDVYGGYYGYVDFDLNVDRYYEKGCILNSRILWFFSEAYRMTGRDDLRKEAEHAWYFLRDCCLDHECGGLYWSVTYDGQPADTTKHTYNQAFAIYALSSFFQASDCAEALDLAFDLFCMVEQVCTDAWGYLESFTRTWEPGDNEKLSENGLLADKTMNTLLHLLEAYTELYRASANAEVGAALIKILKKFRAEVYSVDACRLEVFFDRKMQSIADMYSYGHDIEASWLLDKACDVLELFDVKDSLKNNSDSLKRAGKNVLPEKKELCEEIEKTRAYTTEIARAILAGAFADGALKNECFEGVVDLTRVWWVQAESMVGFYNCYRKTGEAPFLDVVGEIWQYIKNYLIDPRYGGEWFWDVDVAGVPKSRKPIVEPWKCPYHNGRMCMELMKRMDEGGSHDS